MVGQVYDEILKFWATFVSQVYMKHRLKPLSPTSMLYECVKINHHSIFLRHKKIVPAAYTSILCIKYIGLMFKFRSVMVSPVT